MAESAKAQHHRVSSALAVSALPTAWTGVAISIGLQLIFPLRYSKSQAIGSECHTLTQAAKPIP